MWFVVRVGDAKPRAGGLKEAAVGFFLADQVVNECWNVAFGFELIARFLEELNEMLLELGEEFMAEAPEIHRGKSMLINFNTSAVQLVAVNFAVLLPLDFSDFLDFAEQAFIFRANAAIDIAVIGKVLLMW